MTPPVREGEILAGKYRVDRVLGVGGMGVVVAAHHIELDERVALKFMLPEALANAEAVTRFAREARAAVKIKSEHVARVSDVGRLENGSPYMVMEYLEGSDLGMWLQRKGQLPSELAVDFVLQACEAIAEAHTLGIVHRDLKPANLFVIRRPDRALSVKVLDFGISKAETWGTEITHASAIMGSPLYMSPEQMQSSKGVDARSDIWAIGVVLYELLAGSPPFTAALMPELVHNVMQGTPPPLRNKRPDAPDGIEAVILKCLDKDRGRRFQTIGELSTALLPFGSKKARLSVERISGVMAGAGLGESALNLPTSSERGDGEVASSGTGSSWSRTIWSTNRGRMVLTAAAGLVVIGLAASGMRSRQATAPVTPTAFSPGAPVMITAGQPVPAREQAEGAALRPDIPVVSIDSLPKELEEARGAVPALALPTPSASARAKGAAAPTTSVARFAEIVPSAIPPATPERPPQPEPRSDGVDLTNPYR